MKLQQVDFGSPAFEGLLELRDLVLRKPLNMVFTIDQITCEYNNYHFGLYDNNDNLLATSILKENDDSTVKMRQVAVDPNCQNRGIGMTMIKEIESWCIHYNYKRIVLAARDTAIPFYTKLGYKTIGKKFTEVGIPHKQMEKQLF